MQDYVYVITAIHHLGEAVGTRHVCVCEGGVTEQMAVKLRSSDGTHKDIPAL